MYAYRIRRFYIIFIKVGGDFYYSSLVIYLSWIFKEIKSHFQIQIHIHVHALLLGNGPLDLARMFLFTISIALMKRGYALPKVLEESSLRLPSKPSTFALWSPFGLIPSSKTSIGYRPPRPSVKTYCGLLARSTLVPCWGSYNLGRRIYFMENV